MCIRDSPHPAPRKGPTPPHPLGREQRARDAQVSLGIVGGAAGGLALARALPGKDFSTHAHTRKAH
eukprot:648834-Pyramimonas_sp.AAC.1